MYGKSSKLLTQNLSFIWILESPGFFFFFFEKWMFLYAVFGSLFVMCLCLVAEKVEEYGRGGVLICCFYGKPFICRFL